MIVVLERTISEGLALGDSSHGRRMDSRKRSEAAPPAGRAIASSASLARSGSKPVAGRPAHGRGIGMDAARPRNSQRPASGRATCSRAVRRAAPAWRQRDRRPSAAGARRRRPASRPAPRCHKRRAGFVGGGVADPHRAMRDEPGQAWLAHIPRAAARQDRRRPAAHAARCSMAATS